MDFWSYHAQFLNNRFNSRYIDPAEWVNYCRSLPDLFRVSDEGRSEEGRPILHLEWGRGDRHVLIWSQMHGNEPTATLALADLFNLLSIDSSDSSELAAEIKQWANQFTLHIIPMLNPDGSFVYQRRNAQGIDINRDAVAQKTIESQFFWSIVEKVKPELGFNLHDQRTMYSAGHTDQPATISFLAPSPDAERSVNAARLNSMQVGGYLTNALRPHLGKRIARYSDEFYPTSFGDNLQKQGVSALLIESGESSVTPFREETRQANFFCLTAGLSALCHGLPSSEDEAHYNALPENQTRFFDLILTHVAWKGTTVDIGLRSSERLINGEIIKVFEVADIGDLSFAPRFREFNAAGWEWTGSIELEKEPQAAFIKDGEGLKLDKYARAFMEL